MKKNLLFHCYLNSLECPTESTTFNLRCLEKFLSVFDGKKVLNVALDNTNSVNKHNVLSRFPAFQVFDEILFTQNDSTSRESSSLVSLLESVQHLENSITFYGHSKGSTHPLDSCLRNWILSMYFFNLEETYLEEVEKKLSGDFITSGILKKDCKWDSPDISGEWHYSGAFFWFSSRLFDLDWKSFSKGRMSLESYLGQRVPTEKAHSTFVSRPYNFHIDNELWATEISDKKIEKSSHDRYAQLLSTLSG